MYDGVKTILQKNKDAIREILKFVDDSLEGKEYLTGANLTIADISLVTCFTNFDVCILKLMERTDEKTV
jgi:glutathione S-transferase